MTAKTEPKEIVKTDDKALTKITNYLDAQPIQKRFAEIMGERGAKSYVASVLIAVAESQSLQRCAPDSIYISALRAATLRLSVDASNGQAYLVPFKGRATLIVGYKGLHDMAVRTNRYRYINVAPIHQGQAVTENPYTGWHKIEIDESLWWDKEVVIGWLGAFEMLNGYAHTLYMTVKEIHEHAKQYSKSYEDVNGAWTKEPRKMERKTVLRLLLRRWGFLDPADVQQLNSIEEDEIIDAPIAIDNALMEAAAEEDKIEAKRDGLADLGYDRNPDPITDKAWEYWTALVAQADALKVKHGNPDRAKMTTGDLRQAYDELRSSVEAAQAQEESGG